MTASLLFLLAGLAALGTLATNIILPAFPAIGADLNVSIQALGSLLSSYFVVFAVGQLFVGPMSDRFGRRPLVLGGLVTLILGSAICAAATTLPQLIAGRVVQALGVCATSVLARAIARDLFDGAELGRALSLIMVAMAAAPGFSPLLGGAFDSLMGWRAIFGIVAAFGLLLILQYGARLGETHPPDHRSALSIAATLDGYRRLLLDRRFVVPAVSVSLVIGALFSFFALAPAILMIGFGLTSIEMGLFFASTPFAVFVAGLLAPALSRRWGQPRVALAGIAVALAGGLAILLTGSDLYLFYASLTVFAIGMGVVNPMASAIALQPFGERAGAASALLGFLQMGCAAMVIGIGSTLDFPAYVSLGIVLTTALLLALLVFAAGMRRALGRA